MRHAAAARFLIVVLALTTIGIGAIGLVSANAAGADGVAEPREISIDAPLPNPARVVSIVRVGRQMTFPVVPSVVATAVALMSVAVSVGCLVGHRRRRIGDDGDRWRRLLHGAPPAGA